MFEVSRTRHRGSIGYQLLCRYLSLLSECFHSVTLSHQLVCGCLQIITGSPQNYNPRPLVIVRWLPINNSRPPLLILMVPPVYNCLHHINNSRSSVLHGGLHLTSGVLRTKTAVLHWLSTQDPSHDFLVSVCDLELWFHPWSWDFMLKVKFGNTSLSVAQKWLVRLGQWDVGPTKWSDHLRHSWPWYLILRWNCEIVISREWVGLTEWNYCRYKEEN